MLFWPLVGIFFSKISFTHLRTNELCAFLCLYIESGIRCLCGLYFAWPFSCWGVPLIFFFVSAWQGRFMHYGEGAYVWLLLVLWINWLNHKNWKLWGFSIILGQINTASLSLTMIHPWLSRLIQCNRLIGWQSFCIIYNLV